MGEMQLPTDGIIGHTSLINNVSGTYRFVKRFFDLVLTLPVIVLLSPMLLTVALWIKICSRGPILHTEKKFGLRGAGFTAVEYSKSIRQNYIRKLPLLFNVLKGNMSLVGPRPLPAAKKAQDVWYDLRMSVKPGIVGLWQVSRKHGSVYDMVRVDLKYIRERSLWNDFKILLRGVFLMFPEKKPIGKEDTPKD